MASRGRGARPRPSPTSAAARKARRGPAATAVRDVGEALAGWRARRPVVALDGGGDDRDAVAVPATACRGPAVDGAARAGPPAARAAVERVRHGPAGRAAGRRGRSRRRMTTRPSTRSARSKAESSARSCRGRGAGAGARPAPRRRWRAQEPLDGAHRRQRRALEAVDACLRSWSCSGGSSASAAASSVTRAVSEQRRQEPRAQPEAAAPHGSRKR